MTLKTVLVIYISVAFPIWGSGNVFSAEGCCISSQICFFVVFCKTHTIRKMGTFLIPHHILSNLLIAYDEITFSPLFFFLNPEPLL